MLVVLWGNILVYPETDHDAKANGKLLKRNESTTDLGRCAFRVVNRHNHGQAADAHSTTQHHVSRSTYRMTANVRDEAASKNGLVSRTHSSSLDNNT